MFRPIRVRCCVSSLRPRDARGGITLSGGSPRKTSIVLSACLAFGCATDRTKYADRLVEESMHEVNSIYHSNIPEQVGSAAAVAGSPRRELDLDVLVWHETIAPGTVRIDLYTPSRQTSATEQRLLNAVSAGSEIREAASNTLAQMTRPMTNVVAQKPRIALILVPSESGYSITTRSARTASPLPLAFFAVVSPSDRLRSDSTGLWWMHQLSVIAHELLHLEHVLAGMDFDSKLRRVDAETAASLIGWCAKARFIQALGDSALSDSAGEIAGQIGYPSAQKFPGIYRGIFAPEQRRFESVRVSSTGGNEIAQAIVFHRIANGKQTIDLENPETTERLYTLCDGLPERIPRFTLGELP